MSSIYIKEPSTDGKICLKTSFGDLDIELWSKECPLACRNFVQLCMEGYYNGCIFHRLIKDFIIQTGDPTRTGFGGESIYAKPFKSEFHQRLKFSRRGLLGMAGERKDQNGSQFFFTLAPAPELDGKHTLFGKIEGDTIFNLMELNTLETDKNERPTYLHKITGAKILKNPFKDIKIRSLKSNDETNPSKKSSKKDSKGDSTVRNTSLLSFGYEVDEDDEQISEINLKLKPKSAHDVLDDEFLSKESAVKPDELGIVSTSSNLPQDLTDTTELKEERLDRIKKRLKENSRKRLRYAALDDDEQDLEKVINDRNEEERKSELERISSELKQLQKEYKKSAKKPKEFQINEEEATMSEAVSNYNKLRLKFKSGTKGLIKTDDSRREDQTMALLDRFKTKLERSTIQGILTDKKVDMSDQKTQEEIILATAADQGNMDFDATDLPDESWMSHALVAPLDEKNVMKEARDANMKEFDKEWYSIDDPRHPINVQKRGNETHFRNPE